MNEDEIFDEDNNLNDDNNEDNLNDDIGDNVKDFEIVAQSDINNDMILINQTQIDEIQDEAIQSNLQEPQEHV